MQEIFPQYDESLYDTVLKDDDFVTKKRMYFMDFIRRHKSKFPGDWSLFVEGGLLKTHSGGEAWQNVMTHIFVVSVVSDVVAEELGIEDEERDDILRASMLHDWNKKKEVLMEKAKLSEGTIVHQDYLDIWEEEDKKMSDADIPKHIIKLSNAGFPPSAQGHKTLPEKIIWFADATISNDRIVPIEQRNIDLERGWNGQEEDETKKSLNNRKSDLYMEVEGYQGMKLFHVQRKLAREVGSEFIKIMEDAGKDMTYVTPDNLAYYFLDRFIQKVNNYTVID